MYYVTILGQIFWFVGHNDPDYPTGWMEMTLEGWIELTVHQLNRGWPPLPSD